MARTTRFKEVLHRVAYRMGIDPTVEFNRNSAEAVAEYLREAYELAYEWYEWPESISVDEYTVTDSKIEWDAPTLGSFGTIFDIYTNHPLTSRNPLPLSFTMVADGIYINPDFTGTSVWVKWRAPAPKFTGREYLYTDTQAVGDTVYYEFTGECYACVTEITTVMIAGEDYKAPTDGAYWRKLDFLSVLAPAAVQGAYAEHLAEEGQHSASQLPDGKMLGYLEHELDRLELQGGQARRFDVLTSR